MKVKVTRNYQISIPAEIRKRSNIKLGDILDVRYDEERGEIIIKKVEDRRRTLRIGRKLLPDEIESLIESGLRNNV